MKSLRGAGGVSQYPSLAWSGEGDDTVATDDDNV
jgi:hypothetical protein